MSAALRQAAEALLQHYEGDEPHPTERRYEKWQRQLNVRLEELAVALAASAAEEERARAAESAAYAAVIAHYNAALKEAADAPV